MHLVIKGLVELLLEYGNNTIELYKALIIIY